MEVVSSTQDTPISWDQGFAQTEELFNIAGYVPVVSYYAGIGRACMGGAQIVAGLAEELFFRIRNATSNVKLERPLSSNYLICHGAANCLRAFVGINGRIVGNILTLAYDLSGLRYSYPKEERKVDVRSFGWK